MHHQYQLKLNDEVSEMMRILLDMGDLTVSFDAEQPKPYYAMWSHFDNPWDTNEAYGDTITEAINEVYDCLDYILWQECR